MFAILSWNWANSTYIVNTQYHYMTYTTCLGFVNVLGHIEDLNVRIWNVKCNK